MVFLIGIENRETDYFQNIFEIIKTLLSFYYTILSASVFLYVLMR